MERKQKPNIQAMEPYLPGESQEGREKLSSNENPLGPSPWAVKAIESELGRLHRYPDKGSLPLQETLAAHLGMPSGGVMVTNGSDEAFSLLAAAWISPGENGVTARETFSQYAYALRLFDGEVREAPLKDHAYDLQALRDLVDEKTRLVFICNPNNPTGTYRNHKEITAFLEDLPSSVLVVLDEAYGEFVQAPDYPQNASLLPRFPQLVVTRTFSKIYGLAGLRLGYALGHPQVMEDTRRAMMPFNVNLLAQKAARAAWEDKDHVQRSQNLVWEGKAFMEKALNQRGISFIPSQTNFICLHVKQDAAALSKEIAQRGLMVRALGSFGMPRHIRYTLGRPEDNRLFLRILDELL